MDTAEPIEVLLSMLECFETGELGSIDKLVSRRYFDHQSAAVKWPHGPELFKQVVMNARSGMPELRLGILDVREFENQAESLVEWHWRDRAGYPHIRTTHDRIRVEAGRAVEHWGEEV